MSEPVAFLVAGAPRSQGSKSIGYTRDGRAFMRESNDSKLRPWRKAIHAAAVAAMDGRFPLHGPVGVVLTFAVRWPASHEGRQTWPTAKNIGDVDKMARAALDALTGTVFVDDSQVVSLTARKVWAQRDVDWPEGLHVWCNHVPGFTT